MPAARYRLLGKYRTPAFRYGQRVNDARRDEVRIVGLNTERLVFQFRYLPFWLDALADFTADSR